MPTRSNAPCARRSSSCLLSMAVGPTYGARRDSATGRGDGDRKSGLTPERSNDFSQDRPVPGTSDTPSLPLFLEGAEGVDFRRSEPDQMVSNLNCCSFSTVSSSICCDLLIGERARLMDLRSSLPHTMSAHPGGAR